MADEIIRRKDAKAQGLTHYFTGKPCRKGHVDKRFVTSGHCCTCALAYLNERNRADPEAVKRRNKARYDKDPEKWREYCRVSSAKARAKRPKSPRIIQTKEQRLEYQRNWAKKDYRKNPSRYKAHTQRRRKAEGSYTAQNIIDIRAAQKDRCAYCAVRLDGGGHLDHIIPLSKGGTNWPRNLQWLCQPCNNKKSARDPEDFARTLGKLL